ncbi:hypothetical protein M8J76_007608 [Diaphorina citri]|nr:hypothetical protein M8J76_007608 [Diaphorina citri]
MTGFEEKLYHLLRVFGDFELWTQLIMGSFWQNNKPVVIMMTGFLAAQFGWLVLQYDEKLVSREDRERLPLGLGKISFLERKPSDNEKK